MYTNCPTCGSTVPDPPQDSCPYCGSALPLVPAEVLAALSPEQHEAVSIAAFYHRLFALTPRTPITVTILIANLVVFALMVISSRGEALLSPNGLTLIEWGANYGPQTLGGQWWRLLTCMFVHIGIIHIGFNMWVFWDLGRLVERLVGNVGFLFLYLLSGLFGSLASVYWQPQVLSAGASGAVFGVFGALMGFVVTRSDSVPPRVLGQLRNSGLSFLAYNLFFGFAVKGIDMAAHLGGLASGFVLGLILSQSLARVTPLRRAFRNVLMAAVGLAGLWLALQYAPRPPGDLQGALTRFSAVEKEALKIYNQAVQDAHGERLSDAEFAKVIEEQVLPPWRELREHFQQLHDLPADDRPRIQLLTEYLQARQEAWQLLAKALRSGDEAVLRQCEEKNRQVESLMNRIKSLSPS